MSCNPILTEVEFRFLAQINKLRKATRRHLTEFFPYQTTYKTVGRMVEKGFLASSSDERKQPEFSLSPYGQTILGAVENHRKRWQEISRRGTCR